MEHQRAGLGIEAKLDAYGVKKVIPNDDVLAHAYARATEYALVQQVIDKSVKEFRRTAEAVVVPDGLRALIAQELDADNSRTWDKIVDEIARKKAA